MPLAGPALEVLQRLHAEEAPEPDTYVSTDRRGLPIKPDRVPKRFRHFADLAKLDSRLNFHSLRHTTASWLAMKGIPLLVIQVLSSAGHRLPFIVRRKPLRAGMAAVGQLAGAGFQGRREGRGIIAGYR